MKIRRFELRADLGAGGGGKFPHLIAGEPVQQAEAAMVMLHGRGSSAGDILTLAHELDVGRFVFLAPDAPGGTWYPYRFLEPVNRNEPWLSRSLGLVGRSLEWLQAAGIPSGQIMLLGFSQGACLALEYAARHPTRYGSLVGLSGGLIGAEDELQAPPPGSLEGVPVFLGCSDIDPHIPLERVETTSRLLTEAGALVTQRIYPNLGHTVNMDEVEFVKEMMRRLL